MAGEESRPTAAYDPNHHRPVLLRDEYGGKFANLSVAAADRLHEELGAAIMQASGDRDRDDE